MKKDQLISGDALEVLKTFPDEFINCCVTSPPYYGLRDYGAAGQIGHETTPSEYIERLVTVFREVRRVMKPDGTLWVNIGDSYAGSGKGVWDKDIQKERYHPKREDPESKMRKCPEGLKRKDLIGIPWMLAFALRSDGWYLRQDIIWHKPNPMPESVKDRCTKSHEYIFLLTKQPKYYYDFESISEEVAESSTKRAKQDIENQKGSERAIGKSNGTMKAVLPRYGGKKYTQNPDEFFRTKSGNAYDFRPKRNKRDVWSVTTAKFKECHFATFPEKLITPCIRAGCPENGLVLDPFMGSGTVAVVSKKNNRHYIGIDINKKYCQLSSQRINQANTQISFCEVPEP